mmetsp:Transcript_8694/g.10975  ORF Transcript_8694/g.10975 Transcript_8694/m.10975 type:complete len:344 (+) Transcript_8694:58-1089(+)
MNIDDNNSSQKVNLPLNKLKYSSNIPTLRSSSHRVRVSKKNKKIPQPKRTSRNDNDSNNDSKNENCNGTLLPLSIRKVELIPYDTTEYDLKNAIIQFLKGLDSEVVGDWNDRNDPSSSISDSTSNSESSSSSEQELHLEHFQVPITSMDKRSRRGILLAQDYLSQAMHDCFHNNQQEQQSNNLLVESFHKFVTQFIIKNLKARLVEHDIVSDNQEVKFYYQCPPTLRIQPGPSKAYVTAHKDSDYGHQPGELNYWIPLTDRKMTEVDLFVESEADKADYTPLETDFGYASSFFGSGCRHYVNSNSSIYSRVSLDFRVGIEPFYDPLWQMVGTRDDHLRKTVEM